MKVAIYTRVSTDHDEQLSSLKNQEEYYTEYCRNHNYELYKIYADEGISATSAKREQFLEMLYDAGLDIMIDKETSEISFRISKRKSKFDAIIMKDVSRFSRNLDAIVIARKLREKNVYLFFENVNLNTKKDNWEFEFSLYLTFSQQESIDRSKKVEFAYKQRAKKGIFHMSTPLFGYFRDEETGEYKIQEHEAAIVKEIFEMYTKQNMGTNTIAHELNQRGITTRKGKKWDGTAVRRLLKNEKYKGQVVINKYKNPDVTSSSKRKKERDPNEWVVLNDAIPAIIDKKTWEKAKEILEQRVKELPYGTKLGAKIVKNSFHKKIKCAKCMSFFTRVSSTKKRKDGREFVEYNYFCINRRKHGTCDMRGISHNTLEREIYKLANEKLYEILNINIEREKEFAQRVFKRLEQKRRDAEKIKQKLKKEIDKKTEQINKLFDMFFNEGSNEELFEVVKEQASKIQKERKELEMKMLEYDTAEIDKVEKRVSEQLLQIENLAKRRVYTFDEVMKLINLISIHEGKIIRFHISTPSILIFALHEDRGDFENHYATHIYEVKY